MGLPAEIDREMSSVSNDNHSPAAPEVQKPDQNGLGTKEIPETSHQTNGSIPAPPVKSEPSVKTENDSGLTQSNGPLESSSAADDSVHNESKPADISSEDVDVMTPLEGNPSEELRQTQAAPMRSGPVEPEANLKAKLKRVRTHVVSALFKHPKSVAFREPVNAKALGIYPIYFNVIKRPMDLGTVRKKIDRGEYQSKQECLADINQIWINAKTFNLPGHFVHEAAKIMENVTKDKWFKLEQDELAGVYAEEDRNKALTSSKKKPKEPAVRTPKMTTTSPNKEARKRVARKMSTGLPGELNQPQQLKKKYVENLSDQMKQCDSILRQVMAEKSQSEPFLHIDAYPGNARASIDLYTVQSRLQNHFYRHPLQFANDIRRIITETYRYNPEESPLCFKAGALHHRFEVLFSRVDFEPVDNPAKYDPLNVTMNEDEAMIQHLMGAQNQIVAIRENVGLLIRDLPVITGKPRRATKTGNTNRGSGTRRGGGTAPKPKRARPTGGAANQTGAKRRKPNGALGPSAPATAQPVQLERHNLTVEESLALREQVAQLREDQQQKIVDIMLANKETLTTDANGFTEIDLSNCSALTVSQIQAFILGAQQSQIRQNAVATPSPVKKPPKTPKKSSPKKGSGGHLSDSSSDSDSDDDSSSSNSSSSDSD